MGVEEHIHQPASSCIPVSVTALRRLRACERNVQISDGHKADPRENARNAQNRQRLPYTGLSDRPRPRYKSAHGLPKAATTRAAENGTTAHELIATFGWVDIKEAEIYTRAADRKRLATQAINKLGTGTGQGLASPKVRPRLAETTAISTTYFSDGALGGTRTPTILLTATSRQRVYQFRHERLGDRLRFRSPPDQRRRCNKSRLGVQGPRRP